MTQGVEERLHIEKAHLLLVEGKDEVAFFQALLDYLGLTGFQLINCEGKPNMLKVIKTLRKIPGYSDELVKSVGAIRDADGHFKGAFDSVVQAFENGNFAKPYKPLHSTKSTPKVMVMIVPPDEQGRMLEDLYLASMYADPALACMETYFACLEAESITTDPAKLPKARVRTFLASRPEPDLDLGMAVNKNDPQYRNFDAPVFDVVKQFLRDLAAP